MSVELNHTIVWCSDQQKSAAFVTGILGLPPPTTSGPFLVVAVSNGVSLDYHTVDGKISMQHYAFAIGEDDFDEIFARVRERGIAYWADPGRTQAGQINHHNGGRGFYFLDPDGHLLEVLTRP